ncbi:MAG: ABC transporter ATP-binding protein [Acidimicrobiales bacterium]
MTQPAVELDGIWKRFPGVIANAGASLTVRPGTVHAVLGENGAGKTTLMNCLAGVYRPDEGTIRIHGHEQRFASPADAIAAGIGMVHQEFRLVPTFSVAENVVLGAAPRVLNRAKIATQVGELAERFGFQAEPTRPVWQLSMGERQRVEILKALWRDARVLILDEPTAVLTPQEAVDLGGVLRRMVDDGCSIIFISHKLDEVTAFCDEATVLRGGATVASSVSIAEVDSATLASLMVGDVEAAPVPARITLTGDISMSVGGLTVHDTRGLVAVDDVSLEVRAGEIVGIAGVAGNGQRSLTDAIAGLQPATRGSVTVMGKDVSGAAPQHRFAAGLAYVPEDRLGVGLAPKLPVTENAVMRSYRKLRRGPLLNWTAARALSDQIVRDFEVKIARNDLPLASLSGGNLQRLLLGRELAGRPDVVVASQPTRGLDVAGVRAIQRLLLEQRDGGTGVLMVSEDLDELLALADRILVMVEGRIVAEFDARAASRTEIGEAMMGAPA